MPAQGKAAPNAIDQSGRWFWNFLKQELTPYPGRVWVVGRVTIAATIVMLLVMTYNVGIFLLIVAVTAAAHHYFTARGEGGEDRLEGRRRRGGEEGRDKLRTKGQKPLGRRVSAEREKAGRGVGKEEMVEDEDDDDDILGKDCCEK